VPQPDPCARENFVFPEEMRARAEMLMQLPDEQRNAMLSVPTPPVQRKHVVNE